MDRVLYGYATAAAFFCLLLAAEIAWPHGRQPSNAARFRDMLFTAIYVPTAALLTWLLFLPLGTFRMEPIVAIPTFLGAILAAFVGDFFYYWFHRLQHSVPLLWKFHAIHHSNRELGGIGGWHHVSEAPLKALFYGLPLSLFAPDPRVGIVGLLMALHGNYIHSATRLNFGRFAWLVADNRTHRIHHSLEPKHFDKNFGALTMLWDKLFGTAYSPQNEWPDTGLEGVPDPRSIRDYLVGPRKLSDVAISS